MVSNEQLNDYISRFLTENISTPQELYAPITYTIDSGGKKIRPMLAFMAAELFTNNFDDIYPIATAVEIFHNFTLIHDDIMDKSPIRRNKPTVHIKWNENIAILSGDAMMIMAYKALEKLPANTLAQVLPIFNKTAIEVCEGQQYDMNFEVLPAVRIPEYIRMIELKTSVLIAASLQMGALAAGASATDAQLLYNFGVNLGIAFQLRDDYLDVYGDEKTFGKKPGNDIITNKKTFLLIHALEKAQGADASELQNCLNNEIINHDIKIETVKKIYNNLGIDTLTLAEIEKYYQISEQALSQLNLNEEKLLPLKNLAQSLMNRSN